MEQTIKRVKSKKFCQNRFIVILLKTKVIVISLKEQFIRYSHNKIRIKRRHVHQPIKTTINLKNIAVFFLVASYQAI